MKALVVDDEAPARRRLSRMLCERQVAVLAQLEDAPSLLNALTTHAADVVFLDIEMPGLSGLTLAAHARLPPVVFVTAHEHYAARAFDVEAVDYLLKPVRSERLDTALERVRARAALRALDATSAREDPRQDEPLAVPRVVSHSRGLARLFDAREIARFWSSDKYTLFLADGLEQMTDESLSALEERLAPHGFLRVHRAELVRADAVRALRSAAGQFEVILHDGQAVKVSRRALASVRAALGLKPPL